MHYYQRHLGDYARDAGHLSMLEHGAYSLLLDRYYATEKPIPEAEVYRVTRAGDRAARAAVDAVLREFFTLTDGAWRHNRCEQEIAEFSIFIEKQKANGRRGGRKPKETQPKPTANPPLDSGLTQTEPKPKPSNSQLPIPNSHTYTRARETEPPDVPDPGDAAWSAIRKTFPAGTYRDNEWLRAEHAYRQLVEAGQQPEELQTLVEAYAAQQAAKGALGTQFVLAPSRFFTADNWRGPFPLPAQEQRPGASPEAESAWQHVLADRPGRTPRIQAALDAIGGAMAVRQRTPFDEPRLKRAFVEAFAGAAA